MASAQIFTDGNFQGIGNDNLVVANGNLYIYDNSTGLLATTYQDSACTITNTNPVVLSASGKAKVFLAPGTYDIILKTSTDVVVWTLNDYTADDMYLKTEVDAIIAGVNETITDRVVGTIADLRTTIYSGQPFISVTGYHTASDNIGVREYYWDAASTETDNGGTIIQVAGVVTGRWKMKYSGDIDAVWFGAKFDGSDDSTALINAFNAGFRYKNVNKIGNDFLSKVKTNQIVSNNLFGAVKGISVLGDSITHGAFSLNSFNNAWGRIFQKMANVDLQSKSYGVINFLSLGSGGTLTTDIHSVSFSGSWNTGANYLQTLMGMSLSNATVGDEINVTIPSFQNNGNLNYVTSPTGGTFELYINGVLSSTINTSGSLNPYSFVGFPLTDNLKGQCNIKIKVTVGIVEISTIQYYKGTNPIVNLFATSGRKLSEVTDNTISLVCLNSSTLILSLGHNDTYTTALASRIDKLIAECNANNISLVITDFRWNLGIDDRVRQELYRLHLNVSGSIYIPFPELFKNSGDTVDGVYTVTTLGLFQDTSHPNINGHKLIAETIAKEMKLSVTSKEEANYIHNFTMPLALNPGTALENVSIVSSVHWDKSNLVINCLVRLTTSGAFPTGTHVIQTAWNSKYEVPAIRQNWQGVAYIRNDTGAIVSVASLTSAGALTLYVLSSFITNQQFEFNVSI